MFLYIVVALGLWALKFIHRKEVSRETEIAIAVAYPFIMLGMAFLWNAWARHLIGWPAVDSIEELVLTIMVF